MDLYLLMSNKFLEQILFFKKYKFYWVNWNPSECSHVCSGLILEREREQRAKTFSASKNFIFGEHLKTKFGQIAKQSRTNITINIFINSYVGISNCYWFPLFNINLLIYSDFAQRPKWNQGIESINLNKFSQIAISIKHEPYP